MGYRQTLKKQRKIIRRKIEEMSGATIDANKLIRAKRHGWVVGAVMGAIATTPLAFLIRWLIVRAVHHP